MRFPCDSLEGVLRAVALWFWIGLLGAVAAADNRLEELRNLGKAFYENPTTQREAVDTLKQALDRAPGSARERLNYGLALLRAARQDDGVRELLAVQKQAPEIPHTWFTLGIVYKKLGEPEKALEQMQGAARLDPREPIVQYNLGALLKQLERSPEAVSAFERARDLDGNLAAARFQLFNAYRQTGRQADAQRELAEFQRIKKLMEGAAVPEDVDWCQYSEIYDPKPPAPPPNRPVKFREVRLTGSWNGTAAYGDSAMFWDAKGIWLNGRRIVAASGVASVSFGDLDNDGTVDLCAAGDGVSAWRGVAGTWKAVDLPKLNGRFTRCLWMDFDHDYDLDLFVFGEHGVLLRNQGKAGFVDRTVDFPFASGTATHAVEMREVPDTRGFDLMVHYPGTGNVLYKDLLLGRYEARPGGEWDWNEPLAVDWNRDGLTDFLARDERGWFVRVDASAPSRILRVSLRGVKNLSTSPSAVVEVRAGGLYLSRRYVGFPLRFPVGSAATVDVVRVTWANGLVQNEMRKPTALPLRIREAQRLSGSCPIVWTWNGSEFEYITDVLGVAPLGASSGEGSVFPADHDEYISLPGESLRPNADGRLEVRLTEELSEAAYFDRVRLLAVDHPADLELHTSEKWKSPPFPEFRLYGVVRKFHPRRALDQNGKDVTPLVRAKDRAYPNSFRRTPAGVAETHTLTLDFGSAAAANQAVLVLNGWVDWADGSTFLAAAQEGEPLSPPHLQVRDARGEWTTVIEDMGMPSGKPKTIVVDLTGKFLSESRELRIVTNLCVYWDEIYLGESSALPHHDLREVPLSSASLRFRGFSPSVIHPERRQPERFLYPNPTPTSLWNPTPGNYTAYGDVLQRVQQVGDQLAVMGSGDELRLEFNPASLPRLRDGWRRDYLLHVDGWAKDRDANTSFGQTVEPLPYRSMKAYAEEREESFPRDHARPALRLLRSLK
jgi:tetratricopeptide (TPR) repeat protein